MNILVLGDIVGTGGCQFVRRHLPSLKKLKAIDLVIANGENSAQNNGITPESVRYLFDSGVDVITTGNHAFRRRESIEMFDTEQYLLRPANYPKGAAGKGMCIVDKGYIRVCVINIMGVTYLTPLDNPFEVMDRLLQQTEGAKIIIVDMHAEATSEKRAMGYYLDGRISALFGTHTHVATADACILPKGTGYITDLGMTGAIDSVLGIEIDSAIAWLKTRMPIAYKNAQGPFYMNGAIFEIDDKTGKALSVERIEIR